MRWNHCLSSLRSPFAFLAHRLGKADFAVDADAFRRCESGAVQFTVVPVENSTEGAVGRTLDLLLITPLRICAEVELRVQQNLLTKENKLTAVKRVYSHAQSLAQCNTWLGQHLPNVERIPVGSNAEAAQRASKEEGAAAIAGEAAGERYGLNALARSIEDDPNNTTAGSPNAAAMWAGPLSFPMKRVAPARSALICSSDAPAMVVYRANSCRLSFGPAMKTGSMPRCFPKCSAICKNFEAGQVLSSVEAFGCRTA